MPLGVYAIDKRLDDPVGALTAHGLCGIWGTLSCGIFTLPTLAAYNAVGEPGLIYTGSFHQLGAQALGVVVVFAFVFAASFAHLLADQADLRPARQPRGGRGRPGHLRARHVRVPGAVHPGARARGLRCGSRPRRAHRAAPTIATPKEVPGMKKVVAYIRHEAFEPIRMELLEPRVPVADDQRGEGLGAAEGHHRALPRGGADELPAAEDQARVRRRGP